MTAAQATPLSLVLGLSETPKTRALFDGSVTARGIALRCQSRFSHGLDNTGARHRAIIEGEIAGGEVSTSSFVLARMRGVPLRALPVFLARGFRHRSIYCHHNLALGSPEELKGKKVTAHRYNATTVVWVRGLLQNEYGVRPEAMEWYVAEPDVGEEGRRPPPANVKVRFIPEPRTREHAVELVEEGKIDAAFEPYAGLEQKPGLRRLFPAHREVEAAYFHRRGVFPIIHTLVLREEIVAEHPWVVESLMEGFRRAYAAADRYRSEKEKTEAAWERGLLGSDSDVYRLDGCARQTLKTLLLYQRQQGMIDREPDLEELFFPASLQA